jgi:hypothetical protein
MITAKIHCPKLEDITFKIKANQYYTWQLNSLYQNPKINFDESLFSNN